MDERMSDELAGRAQPESAAATGSRRVAILAYGSRGDIQPMIAVGDELRRRGHSVVMTVNVNLAEWARRTGLEIVPMEPDIEAFLKSGEGRAMLSDGRFFAFSKRMGEIERAANQAMNEAFMKCCEGADLVLFTALSAFRATAIAEATGIPIAGLLTMPMHPTGDYAQIHGPARDLRFRALNRLSHDVMLGVWWKGVAAAHAQTRALLGLPPEVRRPRPESLRTVGLYSEALSPRPDDWPADQRVTGFATLSAELRAMLGESETPSDLQRWLEAGDPPVFFGFGSLPVLDPPRLLGQVVSVTRALGLRALVGAGWTDYGHAELPSHVFVAKSFDHDAILPRCRAALHHGGAGTTAAALRAGLPSVVVSVFADQPYWGWRVQSSGVGATLPYAKLGEGTMRDALTRILRPEVEGRARELGAVLRAEGGAQSACDVIETWLSARLAGRAPARTCRRGPPSRS